MSIFGQICTKITKFTPDLGQMDGNATIRPGDDWKAVPRIAVEWPITRPELSWEATAKT